MRKKFIAAIMAGALSVGMLSTGVFATETSDLKGEVNTFIAASLSNAMEEIQKDFNETYPDVEIFYNADSSGTLQTQIEEGALLNYSYIFIKYICGYSSTLCIH